jgi:hypothetical protein
MSSIAFCASTLPFGQIVRDFNALRIDEVVCASKALGLSYEKGFAHLGLSIEVNVASGNRIARNKHLIKHLFKRKQVIIFHECSWPELDLLLILLRIKPMYLPSVTLASRTRVQISEIPMRNRIFAILTHRWFDFYRTDADDGGVYYTPAVKPHLRMPTSPAQSFGQKLIETPITGNLPQRVLILTGTEVVPGDILVALYEKIISQIKAVNIEVHAKDHPNPNSRLGDLSGIAQRIDSDLPLECLDLSQYRALISVASTGLGAVASGKAISVGDMLPSEYDAKIKLRLEHLHSIGVYPDRPRSIAELIGIITPTGR